MKRPLQVLLSIALSAFFIWLSLRGAPLEEVWQALGEAQWRWVALYGVFIVLVHFARIIRWGQLLEPIAKVKFSDLNALGAVGFMALMVLPLRLGELARPYLVSEKTGVKKSAALASVVVERLIDGVSMGLLLVILLWTVPDAGAEHFEVYRVGALLVTGGFGAGLGVLYLAFRHRALAEKLVFASIGRVSEKLGRRVAQMLGSFTEALQVVPSVRRALEILFTTTLYWSAAGLGLKAIAPAFGFTLRVEEAFTVLGLQVLGAMIPTGPGMTGPIQFATIKGVELFTGTGIHASVVAYAHIVWAMQFVQQVGFGLYFVGTGRVRPGSLWAGLETLPAAPLPEKQEESTENA